MEDLSGPWLQAQLQGERLGGRVMVHPTVGSTNDLAQALARAGASEGTVVLAEEQTSGRGRVGRRWISGPGESVLLSVVLRPSLPAAHAFLLTALAATAGAATIESVTGLKCELKWPNDLLLSGKKTGGILTELSLLGEQIEYSVVGIGINVSTRFGGDPELMATATSLMAELGAPVSRNELVAELLRQMSRRYDALAHGEREAIYQEWRSRLSTLGRWVRVGYQSRGGAVPRVEEGWAEDVAEDGALLLRRRDGLCARILAGDVSLR